MPLEAPRALSLFYLTSFAVLGVYLPYFNLYLERIGLTGLQIGTVNALLPLCGTLVPAAGGILADRLGRRRDLIVLSSLAALVAFCFILGARGFAGVALVMACFAMLRSPAVPLAEAAAMEIAESGGPHYGRMRAWGSIAFVLAALGAGPVVGRWGARSVVFLLIGLLALNFAASLLLPRDRARAAGPRPASSLWRLLKTPAVLLFLSACVLSQAAHGPYYVFFSIHLEEMGYSAPAIGLLWGMAVACEVAAMLRVSAILERLGTLPVMALCLLLSSVRWWICSASVAPAMLAAAQALHAATFAAFHVAAVTHTHRLFGEDRRASGQAIYGSATYGAGNVLGMLGSGLLYERSAVSALFARASWVALLGGFLVIVAARREARSGRGL
jgi:PPP family 3-phenylpropionic acid transporter